MNREQIIHLIGSSSIFDSESVQVEQLVRLCLSVAHAELEMCIALCEDHALSYTDNRKYVGADNAAELLRERSRNFAKYVHKENAIERFADLVAAREREACAKVADAYVAEGIGREMAAAIRARGEK